MNLLLFNLASLFRIAHLRFQKLISLSLSTSLVPKKLNGKRKQKFWASSYLEMTLLLENTRLLCKGKYDCMADLLFDRLGFGQTSKSVDSFNSTKQLNPNQSNRRSAVQWYFPLQSNWVFSATTYRQWDQCYMLVSCCCNWAVCGNKWWHEFQIESKSKASLQGLWVQGCKVNMHGNVYIDDITRIHILQSVKHRWVNNLCPAQICLMRMC